MAGKVRLFEKDSNGLLRQVHPDAADAARAGRLVSRVSLEIDVLLTVEEEAERAAKEEAHAAAARDAEEAVAPTPEEKLRRLGLTPEDLKALLK